MPKFDCVGWENVAGLDPSTFGSFARQFKTTFGVGKIWFEVDGANWKIYSSKTNYGSGKIAQIKEVVSNPTAMLKANGFVQLKLETNLGEGVIKLFQAPADVDIKSVKLAVESLANEDGETIEYAEGQSNLLYNCVYEGGAGTDLPSGKRGKLSVSSAGIVFVCKEGTWKKTFEDLVDIDIDGKGFYTVGGNMRGYGSNADAAAKAQYQAAIINSFTTRTKVDCHIRFVFKGSEGYFSMGLPPEKLRVQLAGLKNWLDTREYPEPTNGSGNIDALMKLAELFEKGLITKEEFDSQKSKLL